MKLIKNHRTFAKIATTSFVAFLAAQSSYSVQAASISSITVKGNKRIENATVLSYIPIKTGQDFSQEDIDRALKDLYNTGYFTDVQIHQQGSELVIDVIENAIINKIAFEGNDKFKDDKLKEEVQLHSREVLSRPKVVAAQQRILDIYRRMGRYNATVEPKVIKLPDNRVDLVFEINEGEVTHVRRINFIGNKQISSDHLEKAILTKRAKWFRFFANDDTYDPDRFIGDQHFLRQYYMNHGFPDIRIVSAVSELSPDQKDLFLTFTLEEGDRYQFGKYSISSEIKSLKPEHFKSDITFAQGDWFSAEQIEKTVTAITNHAGSAGFAFAQVEAVTEKNIESKTIDIRFEIKEGPRVYIERIDIRGNDRTRDEVVRREIRLHEGDAYNTLYVKQAEQDLNDLGYFKKVEVLTEQGSSPDRAVIIVKVEEQSTGEFGVAVGFSTLDKLLGNIHYTERNFMGTGRIIHSDLNIAVKRQEFDIGITDPYFMGYNISAGADAFHTRSTRIKSFTEKSTGGSVHTDYKLTDNWFQHLGYSLHRDEISDVPSWASPYVKLQRGHFFNSSVAHSIMYDRRNSRREPTAGYNITLINHFAGLGGDIGYFRNALSTSAFYSPLDEVVVRASVKFIHILKTNKKIRITDSILVGADTFRGFEYGGIGPRDARTRDPLGGTRAWIATLETLFPLGLPNEFGVKGAAFVEAGNVWKAGLKRIPGHPILDVNKTRVSVGVGVAWDSPFGPLRVDYAIPVKKYKGDKTERIVIGVSHSF